MATSATVLHALKSKLLSMPPHFTILSLHNRASVYPLWSRYATSSTPDRIRNLDIGYPIVRLVDPETGRLCPPTALADIVSSIDLNTHFVTLVNERPDPVVKVVSKQADADKRKGVKEKGKKQTEVKTIQLTWGVAAGDLAHKVKKVRLELEKGNRVTVVYTPKKGQRIPSPREMESRARKILELTQDIGKEWKPTEVEKATTTIHIQGARQVD
jgi:translation initiation factor IF-3